MTTARRSLPSWLSWSSWFSNRSLRAAQRQKSRDFADYGTAFGLDMSMEPPKDIAPRNDTDTTPSRPRKR